MSTDQILRKLDLCGQASMVFPLFIRPVLSPTGAAISFLLVGGWQLLSFILHTIFGNGGWARRKSYGISLVIFTAAVLLLFLTSPANDDDVVELLALCCAGLAIWYFIIGLFELHTLQQASRHRKEIHWKQ